MKPKGILAGLSQSGLFNESAYTSCTSVLQKRIQNPDGFQVEWFFHDDKVGGKEELSLENR